MLSFRVKPTDSFSFEVKVERSTRSHVFLGFCLPTADLRTYVGGDSKGWGCIGTGALWHNRSKVGEGYGGGGGWGEGDVVECYFDKGKVSG